MKYVFMMIVGLSLIFLFSCCACAVRVDGPYKGKVIDADTREPIEGVVVLGEWYRETPTAAGAVHRFYDAMETVTDKNGDFEIKGLGLLVLSNVIPMDILIFKAGYEYIGIMPWRGLNSVGEKAEYEESYDPINKTKVLKTIYDNKRKVIWEGDKAIIPLRKLTMEERKSPPGPSSEAPFEKVRLMLKEMDRDDIERGLSSRKVWKGENIE
ncbi:MAG: hypothetical protein ABSA46_06870 [Thermodesulfovibrionales bacterium]